MIRLMLCCLLFVTTLWGEPIVTPELLHLLKVMEIPHDGSVQSIVDATEKRWTRPAGKERWEVQDTLTPTERRAVFAFCNKRGFFAERKAAYSEYDYAILLGGTVARMEKRIGYLVTLADSGIRFKRVVLLAGDRPLDGNFESIPGECKTEVDAMLYLWNAQPLSKNVEWKMFAHPVISTPEGARRPTTADTYRLWLQSSPLPGRCLFFSNQPYCHFQHAAAEVLMPKGFKVETVGVKADPDAQNGVVLLDTIAAWILYESKK